MAPRHLALALLVILVWGTNFVVIDVGLASVPPLLFAGLRFVGVCLFLPFVPRPAVRWRDLAAVGLLMSAGQYGLLYSAMAAGLASGLASLILQAQALFTVALAAAVLRERPRPVQLAGMAVALAGLLVVGLGRSGATPVVGIVLCLVAALSWGAGNVASRRCAGASGLGLTVWGSAFVPVPLLALSLVIDGPARIGEALGHWGLAASLSTTYTVLLSTIFGFTVWNSLLARYPAASVAPFTLLVPVVGLTSGWVFRGERATVASLAGGALLLIGVAIVVLGPRVVARFSGTPRVATPSRLGSARQGSPDEASAHVSARADRSTGVGTTACLGAAAD